MLVALKQYATERVHDGVYRRRIVQDSDPTVINFSSNDYLSLTEDLRIKRAYQRGAKYYPTGSGGSALTCGYHAIHQELERAFARALEVDDCLLFSSGYAANLSVIRLLAHFNTHILIDKQVHASIYDGLQSVGAKYTRYLHNNIGDLKLKLDGLAKESVLITESIFSMSGQCAPLAEIVKLSTAKIEALIVDEAHAFGVLGAHGLGGVNAHNLTQNEVPLRIIPLGKACAGVGAIVAGSGVWIDALVQSARAYIYTTAISPACAYGLLETLGIVQEAYDRRSKLRELISYFRKQIINSGLKWVDSNSAIQQLQLGCAHKSLVVANSLAAVKIICSPMRQPTVSLSATGLRVILNYQHDLADIDFLFKSLARICI